MRLIVFFLCVQIGQSMAIDMYAQSLKFSFKLENSTVNEVLAEIESKSDFIFFYGDDILNLEHRVNLKVADQTIEQILDALFHQTGHKWTIRNRQIIINDAPEAQAPRRTVISGRVTDMSGGPLVGVTVIIDNTTIGTSTDAQGQFTIDIPSTITAPPTLRFSFVGMKTQTMVLTSLPATVSVTMEEDVSQVSEVVITGYQEVDRRKLTSAVTTVKMDDIAIPGVNTVDRMLEGNIPGLIYMQSTGQVGAAPKLRIRGSSTILGSQEPLWVVNGIIVQDPVNVDPSQINDLDFVNLLGNAISGLNPADIEQIDVLKDASATALYGARAANGVIVITTKRGVAGAPKVSYSMSGTFTPRPRYTDRGFHMMNSKERVDVSRELLEKGVRYNGYYPSVEDWIGYERAYLDYYNENTIDFAEFSRLSGYYETMNTDWLDLLTRDTFSHNHTVSVNGGSENIRYYASLGLADEQGNVREESNKRYTATLKTNLNYDKLTAEFAVIGNMSDRSYNPNELNVMSYAHSMNRALPMYGEDGELWYYNRRANNPSTPFNIRNEMNESSWDINQYGVNLTGQVQYRFSDEFSLRGVASYQFGYTDDQTWFGENSFHVMGLNNPVPNNASYPYMNYLCPFGGELARNTTTNSSYTFRLQADWNKLFGADNRHFVNVMGGYELSSSKYDGVSSVERGYFRDRGKTIAIPAWQNIGPNIDWNHYAYYYRWLVENHPTYTENLTNMLSTYLTATYVYDDRYILNVNARADWSNAFGDRSNEKLFPVWSVSGRWNVSDESFMENVDWVDNLALKASYGLQGNMLNNQPSRLIIQKNPLGTTGEDYADIVHFANPGLKWEKIRTYNMGIDFTLFGEKVQGSFDYFYKRTVDAFLERRVGSQNGTTSYVVNAGDLENHGVELTLRFTPIDRGMVNGKRGFLWRFDPQIGQAVNQLINRAINRNNDYLQDDITFMDLINGSKGIPGTALNTFYSFRYNGLDANGRPTFHGLEEENMEDLIAQYTELAGVDPMNIWTMLLAESGTRMPVLQGSLRNYFAYRNFSLGVNLTYSLGNKIRLFKLASGANSAVNPRPHQNIRAEFVDRWRNPGDEAHTDIPGISIESSIGQGTDAQKLIDSYGWWYNQTAWAPIQMTSNRMLSKYTMYDYSDLRVVSGDYLRLQSLQFTYTLGDSVVKNLGIRNAYVSFSAYNLFTICDKKLKGQNPEQFGSGDLINISLRPQYTFSLNINF